MKFQIDNPKLTAFALGELHGPEAEEMKLLIEQNEEARKYVEDIQATARILSEDFAKEEAVHLRPQQRSHLLKTTTPKDYFNWKWVSMFSTFAIACLALVFSVRVYEENKITEVLVITPEMMAKAENQAPPSMEEAYSFEKDRFVISEDLRMKGHFSVINQARYGDRDYGSEKGVIKKRKPYIGSHRYDLYRDSRYADYKENEVFNVSEQAISTFSLDVDTASYSNVRRFLMDSKLPPVNAVRIEELVNYFKYDYPAPENGRPLATSVEMAANPWNKESQLLRIAFKAKDIPESERPAANLVFLIDGSGSMAEENKLPLVKKSLNLLVDKLRPQDRVALVIYAGDAGVYLNSTAGDQKTKIKAAIAAIGAGGFTNGSAGIEMAYKIANKFFIKDGINRVILASDGDFNVGISNAKELEGFIAEKAKTGVFLSVLGFGMGNLQDQTMQTLANKGNGNYAYIDSLREARKALVEQAGGALMTVAKDVKLQVEFNPKQVAKYRLIGYEKRVLKNEDFMNDSKDAGDIGAGHTVTAFYEVFPVKNSNGDVATVKLRYKQPTGDQSELLEVPVVKSEKTFHQASSDFQFAVSVLEFGQLLKNSSHKGSGHWSQVLEIAGSNLKVHGEEDAYRKEFVELVKKAQVLKNGL